MKSLIIDMDKTFINGNILDVSIRGNTIISQLIDVYKEECLDCQVEKDFVEWDYKKLMDNNGVYDYALAFFSLSSINGGKKVDKTIKEVKRVMKIGGKILIWDINYLSPFYFEKLKIKVKLKNYKTINTVIKPYINPFRLRFNSIVQIVTKNGFKVLNSKDEKDMFYIEAENLGDEK